MTTKEELHLIIKKMDLQDFDDVELAHVNADKLLIEAILLIADDSILEEVVALTKSYNDVPKWYA